MKILHTSDLHIGKKLYAYQRNEEQAAFLQELAQVCKEEEIDVVLIAGDLFDTFNPSVSSMTLLYDSLYEISENGKRPIIAIAGNHDSADRIDMPDSFAQKNGIFFLGNYGTYQESGKVNENITIEKSGANYLQLRLPQYEYPLQLIATPFVNEQRLRERFDIENQEQALRDYLQNIWEQTIENFKDEEGVKVLMTHLFVLDDENDDRTEPEDENAINVGGLSAIYSENIPSEVQYTALGHLHRCQKVGDREIWYSGSPLAYSFNEDDQTKYFLIVEIEPNEKPTVRKRKIESGKRVKNIVARGFEEALQMLNQYQDYWVLLHLITETAISYEQTTALHSAHEHLLQIIPEIESKYTQTEQRSKIFDARYNPIELFKEYYKSTHGNQEPNNTLIELFQEIINHKNEAN